MRPRGKAGARWTPSPRMTKRIVGKQAHARGGVNTTKRGGARFEQKPQ